MYNFVKFVARLKGMTSNFFLTISFAIFGSEIRDPGSRMGKNQDQGSGINISDPQHCSEVCLLDTNVQIISEMNV
jgi:hypothetical protein